VVTGVSALLLHGRLLRRHSRGATPANILMSVVVCGPEV